MHGAKDLIISYGQWVVDVFDYLILKYLCSSCFCIFFSLIPTSCLIFGEKILVEIKHDNYV